MGLKSAKMKEVVEENEEEAVCGRVAVHSHVVKIEAITEYMLSMNFRYDSRINEGQRGG